jgi:ABC-2 type transport system ATP-binding protein
MDTAFTMANVVKKYKNFTLGPLNMELKAGTVLGYVGNNGAGKTTTIYLLSGLLIPDEGEMTIFGEKNDIRKTSWKHNIGYVGDAGGFYENWSVRKNLDFVSQFYPSWSYEYEKYLIKRLELNENEKVKALSTGNRMKLRLVMALSYRPRLLLLDEPSSGLDPVVRSEFKDIMFEYMESGNNAMLYSTHILTDISRLADEFAFISGGNIIMRENLEDLIAKWSVITCRTKYGIHDAPFVSGTESEGNDFMLFSYNKEETLNFLRRISAEITGVHPMTIEDISLQILRRKRNVEVG